MKLLISFCFLLAFFISGCNKATDESRIVYPNDNETTDPLSLFTRDTRIERFTVSNKSLLECLNILIEISDPSFELEERLIYVWRTRQDVEAPPMISLDVRNIPISELIEVLCMLTASSWSIRTLDSGEISAIIIGYQGPDGFRPREMQRIFGSDLHSYPIGSEEMPEDTMPEVMPAKQRSSAESKSEK